VVPRILTCPVSRNRRDFLSGFNSRRTADTWVDSLLAAATSGWRFSDEKPRAAAVEAVPAGGPRDPPAGRLAAGAYGEERLSLSAIITDYYRSLRQAFTQKPPEQLSQVADVLFGAYLRQAQVYTLGNGACAALAAHMECDLGRVVQVRLDDGRESVSSRLRVTSLADNAAVVTATANDFKYEDVFVEQLRHRLDDSDVVIAVSSSGKSPNVLRAVDFAHAAGALTVGFTGSAATAVALASRCDITLRCPAVQMEQVEDLQVTFHHIVTLMLRQHIHDHLIKPAPVP
jgi:D-sedoheptulose 7-phosphate isomerase